MVAGLFFFFILFGCLQIALGADADRSRIDSSTKSGIKTEKDNTPFNTHTKYIVNGTTAEVGDFPYQVAFLTRTNRFFCGGSLLKPNVVLTAAHCLEDREPERVRIMPNYNNYNNPQKSHGKLYFADEIRIHPCYDPDTMVADIAMVKLNETISLKKNLIGLINLPDSRKLSDEVIVSGWGASEFLKESEEYLLSAKMQVIPLEICKQFYHDKLQPGMICAWAKGIDSCSGDSGGPMVVKMKGQNILRGIVSWGNQCGKEHFPGVYSDTIYYRDWILDSLCQFKVPGPHPGSWVPGPSGHWGRPPGVQKKPPRIHLKINIIPNRVHHRPNQSKHNRRFRSRGWRRRTRRTNGPRWHRYP